MPASLPGVSEPTLLSSRSALAPFIVAKRNTSRVVSGTAAGAGLHGFRLLEHAGDRACDEIHGLLTVAGRLPGALSSTSRMD
jgi:hypothetical protein